jgi:hypothetical protein
MLNFLKFIDRLLGSHLKIRIFGRDQDEAEDQPTGILKYVEDLIRWLNADIGRKDFFGMASSHLQDMTTFHASNPVFSDSII